MGLFSGITHAISSGWHDLFGGGEDPNELERKRREQQQYFQPPQKAASFDGSFNQPQNIQPIAPPIAPPEDDLNLVKANQDPNNAFGTPSFTNEPLVKANPEPPAPPKPENKILGFARSIVHPFAEFGTGLAYVPKAIYREVQNKPVDDIQKRVFGTSDSGQIAKKIATDTATIGLTALAPGVDNLATTAVSKAIPKASSTLLTKTVPRVLSNASLGSGFGATNAIANNGSLEEIVKSAGEGATIGAAGGGIFSGISRLRKGSSGVSTGAETGTDELSPGLKSTNPRRAEDAANQEAINTEPKGVPPEPLPAFDPNKNWEPISPNSVPKPQPYLRKTSVEPQAPQPETPAIVPPRGATAPTIGPSELEQAANDINAPAYQRAPLKAELATQEAAAVDAKAAEMGARPSPLDRPTFQHKQDIQAVIDQGQKEIDDFINANPGATPQEIEAAQQSIKSQVIEAVQKLQNAREGAPVAPTEPTIPATVTPDIPAIQPPAVLPSQVEAVEPPPVTPVAPPTPPVVPVEPNLPALPSEVGVATADIAPRTHDALVRELGDVGKELKGQYGKRVPLDLEDLRNSAQGAIANMDDEAVLRAFQTTSPDTMVNNVQEFALARAAVERLAKSAGNPETDQVIKNALDAMSAFESRSGQGLRVVQEVFDSMPLPMKVRYIIKNIDNANKSVEGYAPLSEDPAKAALVEQTVTGYLNGSEAISQRVSALEGQLNTVAEAAKAGERTDINVGDIVKQLKTEQRNLAANNGELVKYYQKMLPGRSVGQKTNDLARNMMLASFSGRINDILTTTGNITNLGLQNVTQGILSKAVNLVKPGAVTDTLRGVPQFFKGTAEGARKGAVEFNGTQFAGDLEKALNDNTGARTGLQKATGPVGRTIQAATEFATRASEGVKTQRLYQQAVKEGQQEGLKGPLLKQYAEARAAVPTKEMLDQADQLHRQVNNLNDNPVTHTLNRVAASIGTDKPGVAGTVGGLIKNQVIPFTSWLGGNIYNSITDKNVVASLIKMTASAVKGDAEGVMNNLAKTANNAAYTYALGYLMTKEGLITNHGPIDPNTGKAYNDGGAYLHIGDRYIPVAFTGFFAPSIILGNATYNGLNSDDPNASPGDKIATTASQALLNMVKSLNINSALGADNNLTRIVSGVNQPGSKITAGDIAAQTVGSVAGQYIPAVTGDINAVINNGIPGIEGSDALNPTHEAANTRVTKINPDTGNEVKDPTKSAFASVLNRIPGVSQMLPRKEGVTASDFVDRVTKGSRDSSASAQAADDIKSEKDQAAYDKANNIPNPNESKFDQAVQARIEDGQYASAIEGLKQKIEANIKDENIPNHVNKELEDKIKQLTVLQKGDYDPKIIDMYKSTSLTEWRNMGDPENDAYNPKVYNLLYQFDSQLSKSGVSANTTDTKTNKYKVKESRKGGRGSRGGRGGSGSSRIKSNTIGSTPDLKNISFGNLAPQKIANAKIPTIQNIKPGELIKKRNISVGKAR